MINEYTYNQPPLVSATRSMPTALEGEKAPGLLDMYSHRVSYRGFSDF